MQVANVLLPAAAEPDATSVTGPEGVAHVMLVDTPVPDGAAEAAATHSLAFVGAEPEIPPHAAHLVVTWFPSDDLTLVEGFTAQSRLLTAIAEQTGAVAIHLPAAAVTHPADYYAEVTRVVDAPIMLWTGLSLAFTEDRRHSFLSLGMHQFGVPDLLLTVPADDGSEAIEFFYALLEHEATSGHAPADGELVGPTPELQRPARYEPSPLDDGLRVARIDW